MVYIFMESMKPIEYTNKITGIKEIMNDDVLIDQIVKNPYIKNKDQLIDYLNNKDVHSTLFCTFKDVFVKVWLRIINSEHRDELFKRLNEELNESECKCFTGRLSRLVNALNGYFPDIKINISDNEQISNVILTIKKKGLPEDKEKEEIIKELKEREYSDEVIQTWLDHLE